MDYTTIERVEITGRSDDEGGHLCTGCVLYDGPDGFDMETCQKLNEYIFTKCFTDEAPLKYYIYVKKEQKNG